jgi:hypothetical protein
MTEEQGGCMVRKDAFRAQYKGLWALEESEWSLSTSVQGTVRSLSIFLFQTKFYHGLAT